MAALFHRPASGSTQPAGKQHCHKVRIPCDGRSITRRIGKHACVLIRPLLQPPGIVQPTSCFILLDQSVADAAQLLRQ
eukprot:4422750-Alexandrium_andersonii.AAC.1